MDTIIVKCPVCQNFGSVSTSFIGKQMRCKCGNVIFIKSKDEVCLIPPKNEGTSFKDDNSSGGNSFIAKVKPFWDKTWLWCKIIFNKFILWGVNIIYGKEAVELLQNCKSNWIPKKNDE